jgi:hypothetical protein
MTGRQSALAAAVASLTAPPRRPPACRRPAALLLNGAALAPAQRSSGASPRPGDDASMDESSGDAAPLAAAVRGPRSARGRKRDSAEQVGRARLRAQLQGPPARCSAPAYASGQLTALLLPSRRRRAPRSKN